MAELQAVKGMNDLLPPDSAKWNVVERTAREIFERYGYREIRTPLLEYTPLFVRSIGEATDVVEKEMYTFSDRDERSVTLRPEGTASVVRAYLEHSIHARESVTRLYYIGPMFRHERAQRGRYRQFYQIGVEALGVAEPTIDAEQVAMLAAYFRELGVPDLEVLVNSVGGPDDRPRFRAALEAYFAPHRAELCEDCRRRLERNALRILDCKERGCSQLVAGAPKITDHLGEASAAHFAGFCAALEAFGVPHRVEPRLVRGLDYYTGTTFELRSNAGGLGAQNTLAGGGRYDGLVSGLGGPPTPAVGFALGIERLVLSLAREAATYETPADVFVIWQSPAARLDCLRLVSELRAAGLRADVEHREKSSMKSQFKRADKSGARQVVVIGEAELAAGQVVLKQMQTGEQRQVPRDQVVASVRSL